MTRRDKVARRGEDGCSAIQRRVAALPTPIQRPVYYVPIENAEAYCPRPAAPRRPPAASGTRRSPTGHCVRGDPCRVLINTLLVRARDGSPDSGPRCPGGAPGQVPGVPPVKKSRTDFFNTLLDLQDTPRVVDPEMCRIIPPPRVRVRRSWTARRSSAVYERRNRPREPSVL
jgi:hypothetical protein